MLQFSLSLASSMWVVRASIPRLQLAASTLMTLISILILRALNVL